VFFDHRTIPDETNGVNNAISCYKEAAQFSGAFVTSLMPDFDEICGTAMIFVFFARVTLLKIANTPLHRSAAFSFIRTCTGICQI